MHWLGGGPSGDLFHITRTNMASTDFVHSGHYNAIKIEELRKIKKGNRPQHGVEN